MQLRTIAFDLMGVIYEEGHIVKNLLMKQLPASTDYETVKEKYEAVTNGQITDEAFWLAIVGPNYQEIRENYFDSFHPDPNYKLVLETLKENYHLGILSNVAKEWYKELNQRHKFAKYFSEVVISGEVGVSKPELGIYEAYMNRTKYQPSEILFVDDKVENLIPATTMGFETALCMKEKNKGEFVPDITIVKLSELLELV